MNSTRSDPAGPYGDERARREYWCFISYRHSDNKEPGRQWATWLHQALETYEVPSDLVGTTNERGDIIPDRIFPVFRDEEELPANAELSKPIEAALRQSRFLVVLCSPQAAQSRFVADEILSFKKLGKKDRILAAIIEGEPNASDDPAKGGAQKECFPQPLRFELDEAGGLTETRTEPIAANFRLSDGSPGWTTPAPYREALGRAGVPDKQIGSLVGEYSKQQNLMLLKIVAGVLGVPLGVLTKRDQAYQLERQKQRARVLRRWLVALAVLVLATVASAVWAWQKQREAVAAAKLAEERQYLSGIQAASAQLEGGNFSAARQTLITLPKDQRHHEWALLMEWAGAPMLRVDNLEDWMHRHEKQQPQLIAQIRAAAAKLVAMEGSNTERPASIESPDGSCRFLTTWGGGRHGATACIVSDFGGPGTAVEPDRMSQMVQAGDLVDSKDPAVIVRIAATFGNLRAAAFSPDSSILLMKAPFQIRDYSEPPVHNLGDNRGEIYIVPIPNRFFPAKARTPARNDEASAAEDKTTQSSDTKSSDADSSETDSSQTDSSDTSNSDTDSSESNSSKKESTEKKYTIKIAARHGRDVTAEVMVDEVGRDEVETSSFDRAWSKANLPGEAVPQLEDGGGSRVDLNLWPNRIAVNAVKLREHVDGKPKRALATIRSGSSGTEGLFFVTEGSALLERWDLEKNKLIGQLGPGIHLKDDLNPSMSNWGAAYTSDSSHVFAFPISDDWENGEKAGVFEVSTGTLIQTLAISFAGGTDRGANPIFGFSFSGRHLYASIWDQVSLFNTIWIAEKRGNDYVPLKQAKADPAKATPTKSDPDETEPDDVDPDEPKRFVAWSPDDAWCYFVSDEGETLRVISADGSSRHSIPNAVRAGPEPAFDELPAAAEKSPQGRYALGGFIFSRAAPAPILRLPVAWMDPEMRSVIFRNGAGNYDLVTGSLAPGADQAAESAALLLLKWWIKMADSQPTGTRPRGPQPKSQPAISATSSPAAPISPAATPATTEKASPPASPSPTAAVSPSIRTSPAPTASRPPTASPAATPSPAASASPTSAEKERVAALPVTKDEEAKRKADTAKSPAATRTAPYENSLGMKFVPVPNVPVLFSVWETRVKDYKAFAKATGRAWEKPSFQQTDQHPAVNVSWYDAVAFCDWLTREEQRTGRISSTQSYRLPKDEEWSAAVGLQKEEGDTPKLKSGKVKGVYPWGTTWPPPKGAGNYGPEFKVDPFKNTSPVASFAANGDGLYDMGGNIREWCEEVGAMGEWSRITRGECWGDSDRDWLLSSWRGYYGTRLIGESVGFRCVFVVGSSTTAAVSPSATSTSTPRTMPSPAATPSAAPTVTEVEADRELNTAYTAVRKSLGKAAKEKLKREQMDWLKQRDAITDPAARLKFIEQRTTDLKRRIGR